MEIAFGAFKLTLLEDPTYTAGSADNLRQYDHEYYFAPEYRSASQYGLFCNDPKESIHSCILLAGGGASSVHEHSAVVVNDTCFVGVGDMLCSLSLPRLEMKWSIKVDSATCFGVYYCTQHDCLLSHGEMEIARVSLNGEIVWSASGRDIFSEGFRIQGDTVEAIDFYRGVYRFDIVSGRSVY